MMIFVDVFKKKKKSWNYYFFIELLDRKRKTNQAIFFCTHSSQHCTMIVSLCLVFPDIDDDFYLALKQRSFNQVNTPNLGKSQASQRAFASRLMSSFTDPH